MKISKRNLNKIILEMINEVSLSDEQISLVRQKLSDEGGAAGPELITKVVRDNSSVDISDLSDEDLLKLVSTEKPEIKQHPDGDIVDTKGLKESKKKTRR